MSDEEGVKYAAVGRDISLCDAVEHISLVGDDNAYCEPPLWYVSLQLYIKVVHGSILCDPIQPNGPTHQLTDPPNPTHCKWKPLDPSQPNPKLLSISGL